MRKAFQSYPVLINSDRKIDPDIPSPAQFDHEIILRSLRGRIPIRLRRSDHIQLIGILHPCVCRETLRRNTIRP